MRTGEEAHFIDIDRENFQKNTKMKIILKLRDRKDGHAFRWKRKSFLKERASKSFLKMSYVISTEGLKMPAHRDVFNEIYEKNKWGHGSGLGSVPQYTGPYRIFLSNFLKSNNIRSVLDVGCGDWQISSLIDWSNIDYTGMDVSSVVLANTSRFSSPNIRFIEGDAVHDELPKADLLILKDVLQHWGNADILRFLPKLRQFPRALVTNGFDAAALSLTNQDVAPGGYRPVDLKSSPFNMRGTDVFWYDGGDPKVITLFQGD